MTGGARAIIDVSALRDNLAVARAAAPGIPLIAAIKAEGYGHGLLRAAQGLAQANGFAVAGLDEALRLRRAGFEQRLLLLQGPFDADQLRWARDAGIELVIHHTRQLELLEHAPQGPPVGVWIKIDSGMHRLGFEPRDAGAVAERLASLAVVSEPVGWFTHLASADLPDPSYTAHQLDVFGRACAGAPGPRSIANSAGLLGFPASHGDCVRPGIMLYGSSPFVGRTGPEHDLRPAMHFCSELIAVKPVARGEPVGYAGTWTSPRDTYLGVVAAGYGDGYPRHAPSGTPVRVGERRVPLAGRVSMDMLTVDLGPDATERVGDPAVLWGDDPLVEEIAEAAGTISYELLCGLHPSVTVETVSDPGEGGDTRDQPAETVTHPRRNPV